MQEKISIIVPVYNAGEYLQPMINSVLAQTYKNIELILVDDGSTDGSADVCDKAALKDDRITVIHKANEGQSAARNTGLNKASGDIIAFVDHDDILHPQMYELMLISMCQYNVGVCACDFSNVTQDKIAELEFETDQPQTSLILRKEWLHDLFSPTWRTPVWNKIYKREVLEGVRFGKLHLGEDNLFSYQVIKQSENVAFVHKPMYFQRMHGDNFEYTGEKYFTDLLYAKELILHDVKKSCKNEYEHFRKLFLYECVRIFNYYVKRSGFEDQKKTTLKFIRDNSNALMLSDMPIGHKLLFTKLRLVSHSAVNKEIII